MWGTIFSCCDCSLVAFRKKEDPWNAIFAGAITGGVLAARAGPKAAGKNAIIGGVILALIEGVSIGMSRLLMPMFEKQQMEMGMPLDLLEPPTDPLRAQAQAGGLRPSLWDQSSPTDFSREALGLDTDSVSQFDTRNDDWNSANSVAESNAAAASLAGGSWFNKLWK